MANTQDPTDKHSRYEPQAERFKDATSRTVESTKNRVDRAADSVERGMHSATDRTADAADRVAARAERARRRGGEVVDDAMQHADDWLDSARGFVRERPTQSVAIAVAAGWLIGSLLRRR